VKSQLLASVAVVALVVAGPAIAADLTLKAPPPAVSPWTWSGFYIGGHGGYGWSRDSLSSTDDPFFFGKFPGFTTPGFDSKGWLAGFHAGANWQGGRIVGGLEIDLSATGIKGSSATAVGPVPNEFGQASAFASQSGKFEWLGSARGRLGVLATPDVLLYGTGGLAWTHYVHDENLLTTRDFLPPFAPGTDGAFSNTSNANWRFGWVAGVGGEARLFNSNWLARLEYLHYDFGRSDTSAISMYYAGPWPRTGDHLTADVVRAGLSYKFDPDRFALGYTSSQVGSAPMRYAKAPVAPTPWTWAGMYLGVHGGYGWADDPFNKTLQLPGVAIFPPVSGVDSRGYVAGFQAGANWQSRSMVGGLELDISPADIKGSTSSAGGGLQVTQSDKFDPLGSVRARLGYLVRPDVLVYGTGGLAWTQFTTVNGFQPGFVPASLTTQNWLFGWAAGVGLEARLGNTNWLGRVEYLHYDFGNTGAFSGTFFANNTYVTTTALSSGRLTADVVRAGVSYKLSWPDPSGARNTRVIAKAVAPAVWSWSGFYIGGHGGYGWGNDNSHLMVQPDAFPALVPIEIGATRSSGYVAGFQAGGNWQSGQFVGGLEIDLSVTGVKGASSASGFDANGLPPGPMSGVRTDKFDTLGSVRARLGFLVRPDLLLYGTGGLAWTRLEQTVNNVSANLAYTMTTPSWRDGWVAGAGGELRLWNSNWLARLEYLHYDFGNSGGTNQGFIDPNSPTGITPRLINRAGSLTADVVRAGIDYKLD
jgi:opacity protein-like surface antigen